MSKIKMHSYFWKQQETILTVSILITLTDIIAKTFNKIAIHVK